MASRRAGVVVVAKRVSAATATTPHRDTSPLHGRLEMLELLLLAAGPCDLLDDYDAFAVETCQVAAPPSVVLDGVTLHTGDFTLSEEGSGHITAALDMWLDAPPDDGFWRWGVFPVCRSEFAGDQVISEGGHFEMFPGHYYEVPRSGSDVITGISDSPCYVPDERLALVYAAHSDEDPYAEPPTPGWDPSNCPTFGAVTLCFDVIHGVDYDASTSWTVQVQHDQGSYWTDAGSASQLSARMQERLGGSTSITLRTSCRSGAASQLTVSSYSAWWNGGNVLDTITRTFDCSSQGGVDKVEIALGGVGQSTFYPMNHPGAGDLWDETVEPGYAAAAFLMRSDVLDGVGYYPGGAPLAVPDGVCDSYDCVVAVCESESFWTWWGCFLGGGEGGYSTWDEWNAFVSDMWSQVKIVSFVEQSIAMFSGILATLAAAQGNCGVIATFADGPLAGVNFDTCTMAGDFAGVPYYKLLSWVVYAGGVWYVVRMFAGIIKGDGVATPGGDKKESDG